jgi:hypothetical protein
VPNPKLYLHETIHIIGTGSEAYKRHTGTRTPSGPAGVLIGTWQQSGSTGDWPRVVNLWEMDGWEGWGQILEHQYGGEGQPAALAQWWSEAARLRSGGFDRILEPAPYCPTRAELIRQNVRGRAFIQEIATVFPGAADAYLEGVEAHWVSVAARRGLTLAGAWRTAMRDTEAVLLWCLPRLGDYTRHLSDFASARETREWTAKARLWRTDYRETLLIPSLWCVMHPEWKEGAAERPARRRPTSDA